MKEITYYIQNKTDSEQKTIEITNQLDLSGGFPKAIITNPHIIVSFSNVDYKAKILPENKLIQKLNTLLDLNFDKNTQYILCEGIFIYRKRIPTYKTNIYRKGEILLNKEKQHYINGIQDILIDLHFFGLLTKLKDIYSILAKWNWSEIGCPAEKIILGILLL